MVISKKIIFFISTLFFIYVSSIQVQAQTLKLGYIEFVPVFSTNAKGQPEGLLIDLAAQVIPKAGYTWEAYSYPVKRMSEYVANGKLDLWIGLKTIPDFEDTTYKGKSELLKITLQAFRIKPLPDIKHKEDLKYQSVIILRGFSYGGWINFIKDPKNNVNYIETHDHKAALNMLKAKRADYLLDYQNPVKKALEQMPLDNLKSNTISSFGAYFVVSKKTPNACEVLQNLEQAYEDLQKEKLKLKAPF